MTYKIASEGVVRANKEFATLQEAIDHCHKFQMANPRADLCIESDDEGWSWDGVKFVLEASA